MTYKYKSILEEIEEEFETKKMNSSNNSLPIFPIDIFPEKVKRYAEICAKNLPCPIDYMGSFILGSISAMISNSRRVLIKDGWREPAVLWLGVIGSPSTKKTPALNKSIKPLHDKQTAYYDEYKRLKVEYKKQQQDFSNMEGLSEDAIENPSLLQLYTTDATIEAIGAILNKQDTGLLYLQDELSSFVSGMDRYKKKGNEKDQWLSSWSCKPLLISRKSEDAVYVETPFVSIMGGIQPDRIKMLNSTTKDGFINRILFAYPDEIEDKWIEEGVPSYIEQAYCNWSYNLMTRFTEKNELYIDKEDHFLDLKLSPDGLKAFGKYYGELCSEIFTESNPIIKASLGKLEGYTARFALILELCHRPEAREIQLESVERAIRLSEYFKAHMKKALSSLFEDKKMSSFLKVVEFINEKGNEGEISLRAIYTNKVAGCKNKSTALKLLKDLEQKGFGEIEHKKPPNGGRISIFFKLFGDGN